MEQKYFKYGGMYYKVLGKTFERISAYRHNYGIEVCKFFTPAMDELQEITEAQYNRVRRLILKKLI